MESFVCSSNSQLFEFTLAVSVLFTNFATVVKFTAVKFG